MDKKVVKNYLYSIVYKLLAVLVPLITAPYVSRVLHSSGVGIYSYTYTIAIAFSTFAALGVASYGQREIAYIQDDAQKRSRVFWEIFLFRSITTLITLAVYIVFSIIYKEYTTYLFDQIFIILSVAFDIAWYYQGLENFRIVALQSIAVKLSALVLVFVLVKNESDTGLYILINSLSVLVSNVFFIPYLKKSLTRVKLRSLNIFRHAKGIAEFFVPLIAVEIYSQFDKIMLGFIVSDISENGYYEQSRKIVSLVVGIAISLNNVMMSRVSNLFAKNEKETIISCYKKCFRFILLMSLPVAAGMFFAADSFTVWFFGAEFANAATLLKMSGPLLIFMCVGNFVGMQYLIPTGKQNQMTCIYLISALVNVVLNLLLIPYFYSAGAIAGSVAAEAVSCLLQIRLLKKSEYSFSLLDKAWKYVVGTLCMAAALLAVHLLIPLGGAASVLLDIAVGAAVYFAVLLLLKEELVSELKSFIHSKKNAPKW